MSESILSAYETETYLHCSEKTIHAGKKNLTSGTFEATKEADKSEEGEEEEKDNEDCLFSGVVVIHRIEDAQA